ncbi:MAG: hypothetical protein WC577_02665 [Candidatus Paceibacterota bacterium]
MNFETKVCQNCKKNFTIEPDDFSFYEKMKVLPPTFCPECRLIRRMTWRNERNLYKRKNNTPENDAEILSMYSSDSPYIIYDKEYWWSDKWDPLKYGREYNFQKSFFEQFNELLKIVPLQSLQLMNSVKSQYCNYIDNNKNCYLVFGTGFSENTRYSNKSSFSKDSQDLLGSTHNELCFDLMDCFNCFNLVSSENCISCMDSVFLYGCRNCNDCFGCTNLVNKSYCFFNEQLDKKEYIEKVKSLGLENSINIEKVKQKFEKEMRDKAIRRFANITQCINCTGHNINKSKNSKDCFDIDHNAEDSRYTIHSLEVKDNYDVYGNYKNELCYEGVDNDVGMNNLGTITVYSSNNCSYSFTCQASSNLFGCIGLRGKEYCILNKQYSKEEFFKLKLEIIKQMNERPYVGLNERIYKYGDFFPSEISPWAYNETIAQEYYPLTKEQAIEQGYKWKEKVERDYQIDIKTEDIPNDIKDVDKSIINKVIECEHKGTCNEQCTEAYKIIGDELSFYKRMNLPIPHLCPNCRHYNRLKQRNPLKLWHRKCMKEGCTNEFETSYAPDRPEIVYCEKCYQQEVY